MKKKIAAAIGGGMFLIGLITRDVSLVIIGGLAAWTAIRLSM